MPGDTIINGAEVLPNAPEQQQAEEETVPDLAALRALPLEMLAREFPVQKKQSSFTYAELRKLKDEKQKFLVPELIPAESVTVLIGEGGIGKTQLCNQLCLSVAFQLPTFLDLPLFAERKRCIIASTEDNRRKWITAISKQSDEMKPGHPDEEVDIVFTEGSDFDVLKDIKEELIMRLDEAPTELIICDALSDFFSMVDGDINDNTAARVLLRFFQWISDNYKCAVILIHHASKTSMVAKRKLGRFFLEANDSQGAGAIVQKSRTMLGLSNNRKEGHPDGAWTVNYLHVLKKNLMSAQYEKTAIKLKFDNCNLLHYPQGFAVIDDLEEQGPAAAAVVAGPVVSFSKRKMKPSEMSLDQHRETLDDVFRDTLVLTRPVIVERMKTGYGVGDTKINLSYEQGGFLAYAVQQGWVIRNGEIYTYNKTIFKQQQPAAGPAEE